jgi:hypothetical protein
MHKAVYSLSQNVTGTRIFPFDTVSRQVLGPTEPLIQWISAALSLGGKRPGREADHSPQSNAEVKRMHGCILPLPQYVPMSWCSLELQRQFYLFNFYPLCSNRFTLFFALVTGGAAYYTTLNVTTKQLQVRITHT